MKCINIFHYAMRLLMATEFTEHNTPLCKWNRKELYIMKWHCRCCHRRRCHCCCSSYCVFDSKINDAARCALGIHEIHRPLRHSFYLSSSALSWRSSKPFFLISYCLQTVRQCQPKSQNTRKTGDGWTSRCTVLELFERMNIGSLACIYTTHTDRLVWNGHFAWQINGE